MKEPEICARAGETREGLLGGLDEWRRLDDAVELDRERLVEVRLGDGVPFGTAHLVSVVVHDPGAELCPAGRRPCRWLDP